MIDLGAHFSAILNVVGNAKNGLTKPVFLFVSQLTPMINVDLLIQNDKGQTLLTWRDDEFYGPGWHVPGGIIRFKELAETRIQAVAKLELNAEVVADKSPICIREVMATNRDVRGHFISMLYRCKLKTKLPLNRVYVPDQLNQNGYWQWHEGYPDNMIKQHEIYRDYLEKPFLSNRTESM